MLVALARSACQLDQMEKARAYARKAIDLTPTPEFKMRLLEDPLLAMMWET